MRVVLLLVLCTAAVARTAGAQSVRSPYAYDPLSYTRQHYSYPGAAAGRPDPVIPPAELLAGRGLPSLRLGGIIYDIHQPSRSTASLTLDGDPRPETRALRVGDRIGAYQVIRIRPEYVDVRERVFGTVTRLELDPDQAQRSSAATPRRRSAPTPPRQPADTQ